jgi:hypothetical protein
VQQDDLIVDLRLQLNRDTGRLEISVISESEPNSAMAALDSFFRTRAGGEQNAFKGLEVQSAKTDPESMNSGARRPMWTRTTCDIIK